MLARIGGADSDSSDCDELTHDLDSDALQCNPVEWPSNSLMDAVDVISLHNTRIQVARSFSDLPLHLRRAVKELHERSVLSITRSENEFTVRLSMVEIEQQAQFVVVCKNDPQETLICFAAYSFVSTHRAFLHEIHVSPLVRRQKFGRTLYLFVEKQVMMNGATSIALEHHSDNTDAGQFHVDNGFTYDIIDPHERLKRSSDTVYKREMSKTLVNQSVTTTGIASCSTAMISSLSTALAPVQTPSQPRAISALAKGGKEVARASSHLSAIRTNAHGNFICNCAHARSRGRSSCLDQFNREELERIHNQTYGQALGISGSEKPKQQRGKSKLQLVEESADIKKGDITCRAHWAMWELKENFNADGSMGPNGEVYRIKQWRVLGKVVCKSGWAEVTGITERMQRTIYTLVRRGHSPLDVTHAKKADRVARLISGLEDCTGVRDSEKRGFATCWWKSLLMLMDFMPNEQRIVLRGPGYGYYYHQVYLPPTAKAGLKLSYKTWMTCLPKPHIAEC